MKNLFSKKLFQIIVPCIGAIGLSKRVLTEQLDENNNEYLDRKIDVEHLKKMKQIWNQVCSQNENKQVEVKQSQDQSNVEIIKLKNNEALFDGESQIPSQILTFLQKLKIRVREKNNKEKSSLTVQNSEGHVKQFGISKQVVMEDILFQISCFLRPPKRIVSEEQFTTYAKNLADDEFMIVTYIPSKEEMEKIVNSKSIYDTFSQTKYVDVEEIKTSYCEERYKCGSRKNLFTFIENAELAKKLKLNINKIGQKVIFYKANKNRGMEVSTSIQNTKFTIRKIPHTQNTSKYTNSYINEISYEKDIEDLIRKQMQSDDKRKILIVSCHEERQQLKNKVKDILLRVSKMLQKEVIVVLTPNSNILIKYFQIVPDQFVTVRLLDLHKLQPPQIVFSGYGSNRKFYSRQIFTGPFTPQNLHKFIANSSLHHKEYYERKNKLSTIDSTLSLTQQSFSHPTVVMHQKYGCKGCELAQSYLQEIKNVLQKKEGEKIIEYAICDMEKMQNLEFRRYNILNQQACSIDQNSQDHDTTPQLFLHFPNGTATNLHFDTLVKKLSNIKSENNELEVHKDIIRQLVERIHFQIINAENNL